MPSVTLKIKKSDQRHRKILKALDSRFRLSRNKMQNLHKKWRQAEEQALAYIPERDVDAERRYKREDGKPQYTTLSIPYSYSILMTAHTYWTSVFLGRSPVFQFSARHGETAQNVQAVEAIIEYQLNVGKMMVPYYIWLLDVGKYGLGVLGTYWEEEETRVTQIEEVDEAVSFGGIEFSTGRKVKRRRTVSMPGYQGNRTYNVRPYDFFPDPRVPLNRFQDGEFVGRRVSPGWNTIKRRQVQGYYMNIEELRKKQHARSGDWDPGSDQLEMPEDSQQLSEDELKDVDQRHLIEMVVELSPKDWGLGDSDFPEKWMFTCTDDFTLLIQAAPLGMYHNEYPFDIIELEPEGYALVNRGIPEITKPLQDTMDWLINTHFYNVRKALNDQFLVDPSKVNMSDVLDPLPGGILRLRPEAYGTDPRMAMQQLNVQDVTVQHLRDTDQVAAMIQRVTGVTENIMGLVNPGGRKTATEVRTSSSQAINRLKTQSEYFSAMGFAPHAQKLLQNSQQFYDAEMQLRLAGDLIGAQDRLSVSPEMIKGFYDFVPVDGTLPIDRFAQANLWKEMLREMRSMPELMQQYDIAKIFSWVAQLGGLKNINQFKVQVQPDDVLQEQARQGNIVPLGGDDGGSRRTGDAGGTGQNLQEPGQIPSVGPTG